MFMLTEPKYSRGAIITEYNGTYALVEATQSESGGIRKTWCRPKVGYDGFYASSDVPKGVKLGNKADAIQILKIALQTLENTVNTPVIKLEWPVQNNFTVVNLKKWVQELKPLSSTQTINRIAKHLRAGKVEWLDNDPYKAQRFYSVNETSKIWVVCKGKAI